MSEDIVSPRINISRLKFITHGLSGHPDYWVWNNMNSRCNNPRTPFYHNYGGRGITICDRWKGRDGFPNFLADMGERPAPKKCYSIDRINNNGNYEPTNCRWATRNQQLLNKRKRIQPYIKKCVVCDKSYAAYRNNLYCGRTCQDRAYKKRKSLKAQNDIPTT